MKNFIKFMKEKSKIVNGKTLFILGFILITGLLIIPTFTVEGAQNQKKVDMLINDEDPGLRNTYFIETSEGAELNFTTIISDIPRSEIDNITWKFGDGETSEQLNTTHTYKNKGKYKVKLTIEVDGENYTDNSLLELKIDDRGKFLATIGAGLAVGIAGMGAGIGVGIAGAAGSGIVAEQPDKFGRALVFQALPQTQAIYGLLIAILLFLFSGIIGDSTYIPFSIGLTSIGIGLAVGVAGLSAIGQGIAASGGIAAYSEDEDLFGRGIVFSVLPETQAIYGLLVAILLMVFTGLLGGSPKPIMGGLSGQSLGLIAIGAGLSIGVAGLSGIGQGIAASSGIATIAENEEMFGRGMVFSVLPETQAIYGLLVAILLMVFSQLLGSTVTTVNMGIAAIGAGLAIGIAGLSGIGQGITSGSAIAAVSRNEETFGKGMIFSVMSETFAIFGLLIAIFIIVFLGFMG